MSLGVFDFYLKKDVQLYTFDEKPIYFLDITHIQIVILETYGDNRTFINKFYIFEDITIDETNPIDTNQQTCTNYNINTTSFTTSSVINNNNNININYAYNANSNNNNNATLFTNYLTSISNTNGNLDLIETTSNINNNHFNSDISVNKKSKSKPKVIANQITKLFKTHFDQKISTLENEVCMINKKIDLFINKLNNNTPMSTTPHILSLQSYTTNGNNCINKQNNMKNTNHKRWHSKAYVNKIRDKKINITLSCLDKQIKQFKINFDNILNMNQTTKNIYKEDNNNNHIITTSASSNYMKIPLTNKKSNYYNTTRNEYFNQTNSNTKRISRVVTQSQTNPNTMIATENYLHSNKKLIHY